MGWGDKWMKTRKIYSVSGYIYIYIYIIFFTTICKYLFYYILWDTVSLNNSIFFLDCFFELGPVSSHFTHHIIYIHCHIIHLSYFLLAKCLGISSHTSGILALWGTINLPRFHPFIISPISFSVFSSHVSCF